MFDAEVSNFESRYYQEESVDALIEYCFQPAQHDVDGKPIPRNPVIALPTGTGKSLVIALFLKRVFELIPGTRGIVATHVEELIKQNSQKLFDVWPFAPVGFYSASMSKAESSNAIIFGSIQSMRNKTCFGFRNFLLVDEAHLIGDEGGYIEFINILRAANPYLIVIMLTATPYRLRMGLITNGPIATDIIYNMTNKEGFTRLMAEGYLCPVISKKGAVEIDTSKLDILANDFNQKRLQQEVMKLEVTQQALNEAVTYGVNRGSWLVFASGIEHAEAVAKLLQEQHGISTVLVHSKKEKSHNREAIADWKAGKVRCAVNMNGLTTGVDNPLLDYIICLRPTASTVLWVQMIGRGTRPFDWNKLSVKDKFKYMAWKGLVKQNCLCMDYAGNTRRLGPINDPVIPRPKGEGPPGDAPVRICPQCNVYNHARARFCIACNYEFPITEKLTKYASDADIIRSDLPQSERFEVTQVFYTLQVAKLSGKSYIKVMYTCGKLRSFTEPVSVEKGRGLFTKRGRDWFRQRHSSEPPETNEEVMALAQAGELRVPRLINVWINKETPEVLSAEF